MIHLVLKDNEINIKPIRLSKFYPDIQLTWRLSDYSLGQQIKATFMLVGGYYFPRKIFLCNVRNKTRSFIWLDFFIGKQLPGVTLFTHPTKKGFQ